MMNIYYVKNDKSPQPQTELPTLCEKRIKIKNRKFLFLIGLNNYFLFNS